MVLRRAVLASICALPAFLIAGCGAAPNTGRSIPVVHSQYRGSVHGGQQPVTGAAIQLYTVGTTADGSAATPLLTSTVTSGTDGTFTITGLYSCTNATQVYIVATGGNPGLSTANPDIALMAALGPCSSLTPSTFININELTTVAAVSALAPFMISATAIGASPSNATSLANAFTLANEYVNTTTGLSPGASVPSGDTVPTAELNTLADILSACINSAGGTVGDGSLCGQLFSLTTISPSPAPTNTIQAMLNIAYNPTLNTSALYALTPPAPPFQPTLTSAPANFLVSMQSLSPIEPTQSAINFQNVTVGSQSAIQTITLQNFSNLGNFTVVGPNATDFRVGNFSSTNVGYCASGATSPCWIQVYAFPSAAGVRNASLAIDYNYQSATLYIPLTVTGVASNSNSGLSTSLVDFPPTLTGTSSTPVPVSLSNNGPGTLTVSAVTINGTTSNNFTQTNNCSSVAINASCTIYITFAPTSTSTQSATLQVTNSATGSNTVALSGTGAASGDPGSIWPPSLTYTIWGANEDIVLTNAGGVLGLATTGGLSSDHSYMGVTFTCNPPQTSCSYIVSNVAVHPLSTYQAGFSNVTGQAYVQNTSLTSNILTENNAYLLQSTGGVNGNGISGTITFPAGNVGQSQTATIQLGNIGSGSPAASLAIGGANPGDFSVSAVQPTVSSTPSSFCPAATTGTTPCTITVTFTPTAAGARTAKISLDANGSSTGQYIYVTGTAQ